MYSKGARGENELAGLFGERGYACIRAAGSGTANRENPDLMLGKDGHIIVLEAKRISKDRKYEYIPIEEVDDLKYFADKFNAEYYIVYRYDYGSWNFVKETELHQTDKNYRCERDINGKTIAEVCKP